MRTDRSRLSARGPRRATTAPFEHHVTPVPTQALARLDRFATASLLAAGLAHEIANPLIRLMAALDWTNERVERLRKRARSPMQPARKLATDVELALGERAGDHRAGARLPAVPPPATR